MWKVPATIAAKTMWKNPLRDESHRAQGKNLAPPNTSDTAISRSLFKNTRDFLEKSKPSAVVDENGLGARGEVGTQSPATQTAPTFSRDDLGASLDLKL